MTAHLSYSSSDRVISVRAFCSSHQALQESVRIDIIALLKKLVIGTNTRPYICIVPYEIIFLIDDEG